STENKAQLYPDENNFIGFKIDACLVLDLSNGEYDLVTVEVAKDDHDSKVIRECAKLLREAKSDLD
ncbi:hypothetical protein BDA99DRAFT_426229, partial [Phascolomyces articulosus]